MGKWKQAYKGPFTKKEAMSHARSILRSARSSPYMSASDKRKFKTTVRKKGRGYQVYYWDWD